MIDYELLGIVFGMLSCYLFILGIVVATSPSQAMVGGGFETAINPENIPTAEYIITTQDMIIKLMIPSIILTILCLYKAKKQNGV